jgi:hypothetical protein
MLARCLATGCLFVLGLCYGYRINAQDMRQYRVLLPEQHEYYFLSGFSIHRDQSAHGTTAPFLAGLQVTTKLQRPGWIDADCEGVNLLTHSQVAVGWDRVTATQQQVAFYDFIESTYGCRVTLYDAGYPYMWYPRFITVRNPAFVEERRCEFESPNESSWSHVTDAGQLLQLIEGYQLLARGDTGLVVVSLYNFQTETYDVKATNPIPRQQLARMATFFGVLDPDLQPQYFSQMDSSVLIEFSFCDEIGIRQAVFGVVVRGWDFPGQPTL